MERVPYSVSRKKKILFLSLVSILFVLLFRSYIASLNMWRGEQYFMNKQLDKSIDAFKKALILTPGNAKAHSALGWIYLKAGMKEAAKNEYLKANALGIKEGETYFELGMIYYEERDFELAISEFRSAVFNDEDHLPSHIMLALALEKNGNIERAIGEWKRIKEDFPKSKVSESNIKRLEELTDR